MTKQASNARKHAKAREITLLHKDGKKGPAQTHPLHGKRPERRLYSLFRRGSR